MSLHPTKEKQHPDDLFPTRYREHSCLTHLPDDANDLPVPDEDSVPVHSQLLDSGYNLNKRIFEPILYDKLKKKVPQFFHPR